MQTREDIWRILRDNMPQLTRKYPLASLELLGSYARNEQTPASDVDFLVEFNGPIGLEIIDLIEDLEKLLSVCKVDLISKKYLKPHYKIYTENDLIHV
ncbi:MAG TPA: nucleotidyltransferase family protein [Cyclobacteriaceae bacterium]|nr:nucleotidyltransferase family protein [Cyclobacteriaceae bacterium]